MRPIPDRELVLTDENDFFKTRVYVDTLNRLVEDADASESHTIGLFGGWGTGKSSIVRTLRNHLEKQEKIAVITYDAWKYSNDAFRRSFLLEIKNQLGLDPKASFEEFYYDKVEDIGHNIRIRKLPFWFTSPLILLGLSIILISFFASENSIQKALGIFSGVGITLFTLLLQFVLQNLFITYKISQTRQKLFSPEQFEQVFREAVEEVTSRKRCTTEWIKQIWSVEKKVDKIVIIIDNIDRCHKQLSTQLLLTVKNFLEMPRCVFVIPIDDEAIKSHLDFNHSEGEEFLRKFFSTTIRIKKYSPQDLSLYRRDFLSFIIDDFTKVLEMPCILAYNGF